MGWPTTTGIHKRCQSFRGRHPDGAMRFEWVAAPTARMAAFNTLQGGSLPASYAQDMAQAVLRSLGVERAKAQRLASLLLDDVRATPDSLLARARALELAEPARPGPG